MDSFKLRLAMATAILAAVFVEGMNMLNTRVVHSSAVCDTSYDWMQNQKAQSPCDVSAYVYAACLQPNFDFPALEQGNQYQLPNATTQNQCRCSWATYNLVMGCSICQGTSEANVANWAAYIEGCTDPDYSENALTTYWPSVPLSSSAIPFWAGRNPASWSDGHFNVVEAKALAAESHPDLAINSTTPKKKSPIGPIVGGVIGGLAVVAAAVGIFICIKIRRARAARLAHPNSSGYSSNNPPIRNGGPIQMDHVRNLSNSSTVQTKYPSPPLGVGELSQRPFSPNSSNNIHSVSYFGTMGDSFDRIQQQPPGHRPQRSADSSMQNVAIEPFMLQSSGVVQGAERKGSLPTMYPDYDNPNSPPAGAAYSSHSSQQHHPVTTPSQGEETASIVTTPPRARMTPPAYSRTETGTSTNMTTPPYANTPSSYTHRRGGTNEKNGSMDTETSWGSQEVSLPTGAIALNPDAPVAAASRRERGPTSPRAEM